ncbi:N-acetyltransferase [Fructobacillus sp. M1-13]|uniref:N-acetyltransferase n=1 Tax=Fructobacillus papyriferae TaxID=2713171 RepID=A0ABS5QQP2_9LACO|nr:GNAT family N-acetyltransferase [Fructobacillus papyriferae]MBS9335513.1 N-acetyltransferase [Fructobacillus papyriferae]MCD2159283.1 N-acetyltransferase [Fructobacillus papyriferae]
MTILKEENGFYYEEKGKRLGAVVYQGEEGGQVLALTSTYVDPNLRGQNIARQLVDAVCDLARSEGKKVRPDCRYAQVLFRRFESEYEDVAFYKNDSK